MELNPEPKELSNLMYIFGISGELPSGLGTIHVRPQSEQFRPSTDLFLETRFSVIN